MSAKVSAKKNYVYNLIYQILCILLPLVTTPYISRVLSPEGVGQTSFALSICSYFTIFASFGFNFYAQRIMAKTRDDIQNQTKVFYEILFCRIVFVLISIIINLTLVFLGVYQNNTKLMLILTINIVATAFDISFFFQGNENFSTLVIKNVVIRILGIFATFIFVKTQSDTAIYVFISSASALFSNIFMWLSLKGKICKIKFSILRPFNHLFPAFKLFIPTIAISIYTVLDKSLIGIITKSNAENGYYEQAEKLVKMTMTVVTSLSSVMIPRNSYEAQNGNFDKVKENCYKSTHFIWLFGIPIMCSICLVSTNLVPWFLGEGYEPVIILVYILSFLNIAIGLSNVLGLQYIIPLGKDNLFSSTISLGSLINLVLNIPLIHIMGAKGAAISTVIAESFISLVMLIALRRELNFKNLFSSAVKPIIASIIMVVFTLPLAIVLSPSVLNTFIIVVIGIVSYFIAIILLRDSLIMFILEMVLNKLKRKRCENVKSGQNNDEENNQINLEGK